MTSVHVSVPFLAGQYGLSTEFSLETFEAQCGGILDQAVEPISAAMKRAGLGAGDIGLVLLAGGSSYLPGVTERVERLLGVRPQRPPRDPMCAVAYGAALYHRRLLQLPQSSLDRRILGNGLGLLVSDRGSIMNKVMLLHNQELPAEFSNDFPLMENQERVQIELRRGEDTDPSRAKPVRSRILQLRPGVHGGGRVRVQIRVDENRIIRMKAFDPADPNNEVAIEVDSGTLRDEELAAERDRLRITPGNLNPSVGYRPEQHPCIGIDLGTTTSELAYCDRTGNSSPRCLDNPDAPLDYAQTSYPSVIYFPEGEMSPDVASKRALSALEGEKGRAFDGFKTRMGQRNGQPIIIDDIEVTPSLLSAHLLSRIWRDAQKTDYLGGRSELRSAVVTVPAAFGPDECADTQNAAKLAGITDVHLIDEPTAAFLYYQHLYPELAQNIDKPVVVFDFGGGTADVTILDIRNAPGVNPGPYSDRLYRVLSTDGNPDCGGRRVDKKIAEYLQRQFEQAHGYSIADRPSSLYRLRQEAEKAKVNLATLVAGGA